MGGTGLLTVGHGSLSADGLADLLTAAGVATLVDIRRFPGSRGRPYLLAENLAVSLPAAGVAYRSDTRLGGRRTLPPGTPSADPWWTVEAFRAYAAHTRTEEFAAGLADLLADVAAGPTAVMCSESVWWRCHRRLVADVCLLLHGLPVRHLMPNGSTPDHQPSEGARVAGDRLLWDAAVRAPGGP